MGHSQYEDQNNSPLKSSYEAIRSRNLHKERGDLGTAPTINSNTGLNASIMFQKSQLYFVKSRTQNQ